MKPGITIALFISIVLIGGAFWTRIDASRNQSGLIAVDRDTTNEDFYREIFLNPSVDPTPTSTQAAPEPLTGTDLVGRQLIMDYVDLASMGQASNINIELLAERYAESIPTLVNVHKIGYLDIKTVPNNLENLRKYSNDLAEIYIEHQRQVPTAPTNNLSNTSSNNDYTLFFQKMGSSSAAVSERLKNLSVPNAMATLHLELTNIHISNSITAPIVQKIEEDPLYAMAALTIFNENLDKEIHTLQEMGKIFNTNGI